MSDGTNSGNFFAELKRRNVYKVAVAYAIVAWLLIQVATQVFPFFEIPNWAVRLVVLLLILGFPIALFLAWAFEIRPETRLAHRDAGGHRRRLARISVVAPEICDHCCRFDNIDDCFSGASGKIHRGFAV